MSLKTTFLTYFFAIFAILLASRNLISIPKSSSLKYFVNLSDLTTSSSVPNIISLLIPQNIFARHHKKHEDGGKIGSICDDFPRGFPPPDTNTTSYLCVDRNGCCNFTLVQAAVDAVPTPSPKRTIIWINKGIYYEKVTVPKTKPNITFQGQGYETTAISWNDTANSSHGTFYSGSVQVFADNFVAKNISFMNVAPIPKPGDVGAQAVAIRISGDQAAFLGCGFFGAQDTLHDDRGRHYFKDCYIQGSIDFIFGNGRSLYENCQLISMSNPVPLGTKSINGAVTAHGRASKDDNTGYAFVNCFIGGTGRVWLGRAWRPFSRVVFASTTMTDIIAPEGWNDFNDPTRDQTIFYGEYNCSGAGANMSLRAPYVQKLNDTQASLFLNASFIDGGDWLQSNINY
ncbi:pectinesterase 8 [Pyrus ussuriensis x Pyrus communis]|uniref:Pectinesterase n=1 Tax=Pyrus ussuriensis x Pyrus communis TaxID=2448454 RepID=A0A5N5GJ96_9ROSA|nr:probable pectinesterase 8 [Pyrus x bretschneideri]KAB2613370.1 pectinesterase 8 [Pyrus ussuriensis x Pyrus communis]